MVGPKGAGGVKGVNTDDAGLRLPAVPFTSFEAAQAAAFELLEATGHGRWAIVTPDRAPGWWEARPTIPLTLLDGTPASAVRLTGPVDELAAGAVAHVRTVASLLASLLDVQNKLDLARRRAVQAEEDSLTDALTGLPNTRAWWKALRLETARALRHKKSVVVAVIDLDGFKAVNDSQGHLAGDLLLRLAAEALRESLRAEDVVARIGGDEFGVVAVDFEAPIPDSLVGRLRSSLAEREIEASVGAVVHQPGDDPKASFARADEAMYEDKLHRSHR